MIDETLFEAEEKMERAVEFAKDEFAAIRTGRATPGMFSRIVIDYYGAPTPLPQMASIAIPEPRMVLIKPHDPSQLKAMEKATSSRRCRILSFVSFKPVMSLGRWKQARRSWPRLPKNW